MERNPLARLRDFGQSVWCDDIGRDMLLKGELRRMIEEDGVAGVTSNPTIFHKAITASATYDEDIGGLVAGGADSEAVMEGLMLKDIGLAAKELRPVFDATAGLDGYVSIEVAPRLAYDTMATESDVRRVRARLDHPNVLVKVPATAEGVAAIRDLVGQGYSINVTLIFALQRYQEVMEAYIAGLEHLAARRAAGEDVPALGEVRSVASFFVSRVDSAVDKRLDALAAQAGVEDKDAAALQALKGKAAVANAKEAYRLFRETFSGSRWQALTEQGAHVQRPLWASTSTKNPAYPDILYVQELIGPDTVNTMPLNTIAAYRDHGRPAETVTAGQAEAGEHLQRLAAVGIDMDEVTTQLEVEGVKAFADSHEALLSALEEKRRALSDSGC